MKLEEKLVHLRKEKGLTQLELAEAVKVSRQAVSWWEVGSAFPSTENLRGLSELYGVPVDYLLNENEEKIEKAAPPSMGSEDAPEIPCKSTKRMAARWGAVALAFLILAGSIGVVIANKNKEELICIDEMLGEEVEPDRSFNVGW